MYGVKYKTIKDIKIAKQTEIGKATCDILKKNPNIGKVTVYELMQKDPKNFEKIDFSNKTEVGTFSIRNSTRLGEEIVNEMLKSGYGGVADGLGYNVSNDPLIIFDPDKKMKKVSTVKYE